MARDYVRNGRGRPPREEESSGRNWRWPFAGILIVLFVAGIFYLKQQSDKLSQAQGESGGIIQRTLKENNQPTPSAAAPNKLAGTDKTAATKDTASAPPQPKFDFYTMLPKGGKPAPSQREKPAPAPAATLPLAPVISKPVQEEPKVTTTPSSPPIVAKKPAAKIAHDDAADLIAMEINKLEADKTTLKATPAPVPESTAYIVQLGVFKNYNDADHLKAQMVLQGLEVNIKALKKTKPILYRVYLGPYPSLNAAKKQQQLLEASQIKSRIAKAQ